MSWPVLFAEAFEPIWNDLPKDVQAEARVYLLMLKEYGPTLSRPHADTLKCSMPNLKELRMKLNGEWRFFFAFSPKRNGIILLGGNKAGNSERFYKDNIKKAIRIYKIEVEKEK